jgi:simple sugar transport system permease protein
MSTTPLLLAGLSVAFAFHCGLFNIGAEGQLMLGGLAAGWAGYAIQGLPWYLHLPLALLCGVAAGALWSLIAGALKAWKGIHEVISTIMLNYIAFNIGDYMVSSNGPLKAAGIIPATPYVLNTARLLPIIPNTRFSGGIFIALVMAVLMGYVLWHTRLGYRIRAVGKSPSAAEYAGIPPRQTMLLAMAISGGLAGLAGAVQVLGLSYRFSSTFSPGYGFDAIAIALLGSLHPFGIVLASLLFGILHAGSVKMQQTAGVSNDIIYAISGIIIFFVALRGVLVNFQSRFSHKNATAKVQK